MVSHDKYKFMAGSFLEVYGTFPQFQNAEDAPDIHPDAEDNDLPSTGNEVDRKCAVPEKDFLVRQTTLRGHFVLTFENEDTDSLHMYRWYSRFGK